MTPKPQTQNSFLIMFKKYEINIHNGYLLLIKK